MLQLHLAALDTPFVYQKLRRLAQRYHHGLRSYQETLTQVSDVITCVAKERHRVHGEPWPSPSRIAEAAEEALAYRLRRVRAQAMNNPRNTKEV